MPVEWCWMIRMIRLDDEPIHATLQPFHPIRAMKERMDDSSFYNRRRRIALSRSRLVCVCMAFVCVHNQFYSNNNNNNNNWN